MSDKFQDLFVSLGDKFIAYMPNLLAGIILILIGWLLGWFAKRTIIQMAVILRLERYLVRSRWGEDFSRGDVRYGFYNFLGNITFFIILVLFLNAALSTWKLTILSKLVENGIIFFPKLIVSLIIFAFGYAIASWAGKALLKALRRENIPRTTLVSRFIKTVLLIFFSAMALVELQIAREIVIIGFATIFITLGVIAVILTAAGGKEFVKKIQESFEEE